MPQHLAWQRQHLRHMKSYIFSLSLVGISIGVTGLTLYDDLHAILVIFTGTLGAWCSR